MGIVSLMVFLNFCSCREVSAVAGRSTNTQRIDGRFGRDMLIRGEMLNRVLVCPIQNVDRHDSKPSTPRTTALTIQTCAGFLVTTVTIRLVPEIQSRDGWGPAMALLAAGPELGIWQMSRLRAMGEASKMASGNR